MEDNDDLDASVRFVLPMKSGKLKKKFRGRWTAEEVTDSRCCCWISFCFVCLLPPLLPVFHFQVCVHCVQYVTCSTMSRCSVVAVEFFCSDFLFTSAICTKIAKISTLELKAPLLCQDELLRRAVEMYEAKNWKRIG